MRLLLKQVFVSYRHTRVNITMACTTRNRRTGRVLTLRTAIPNHRGDRSGGKGMGTGSSFRPAKDPIQDTQSSNHRQVKLSISITNSGSYEYLEPITIDGKYRNKRALSATMELRFHLIKIR